MKGCTPSAAQKRFHDALVSEVGCIACRETLSHQRHDCSIHHIEGRTKKNAHWFVLALCAGHHQDGTGDPQLVGQARHPWKARFEEINGSEWSLWVRQLTFLPWDKVPPELQESVSAYLDS